MASLNGQMPREMVPVTVSDISILTFKISSMVPTI